MSVDAAESVDGSVSQDTPMAGPVPDAPGAAALQGPDQGVAVDQAVLVQSSQESLFTFTAPTTDSASDIASNPFGTFSFGGPPASLLSAEPGDPLSDTAATAPSDEPAAASLEGTAEPALAQEAVRDDQEQGQDQAQQPRQRPRRRWAKPVSPVSSATSAFASSSAPTSAPSVCNGFSGCAVAVQFMLLHTCLVGVKDLLLLILPEVELRCAVGGTLGPLSRPFGNCSHTFSSAPTRAKIPGLFSLPRMPLLR